MKIVPTVLLWIIDFIRKNGLNSVGIFRLSGDTSEVERIRKLYDEGNKKNKKKEKDLNWTHTMTST
jgi:hypothetical protein